MNGDTAVHLYNIILLSNKKEHSTDTFGNMNESLKYYMDEKHPDTERAYCRIVYVTF